MASTGQMKTELDVEALISFFSNPCFWCVLPLCIAERRSLICTVYSRMWVVQEAVVAPYNECFCGEHEINLRIIMRVAVCSPTSRLSSLGIFSAVKASPIS